MPEALRLGEARAENAQLPRTGAPIEEFLDDDHLYLVRADVDAGGYAS